MKLFCRSTKSQREFMKKLREGISYELSFTTKPNFSPFGTPENGFGVLFSAIYVEENFTHTANVKMLTFT